MTRQRPAEQVRSDAIAMGLKKASKGCPACADGYFELARQHGATEEEIKRALESATKTVGKGLSRRELIKLAAAGALALGTVTLTTKKARANSSWWGTDSSSQTCCGVPQDFYIGRMGYGMKISPAYFNVSAAQAAGLYSTYGYWGVVGPNAKPRNLSAYAWGQKQADKAFYAWQTGNSPNAYLIGGYTIFGDVESGFGGWKSGNYSSNQQVLNGFLDELYAITPSNPVTWPGLYISPLNWSSYFGQSFVTNTNFVLWVTGCDTCGSDICSPCDTSCDTFTTVDNRLFSTVTSIGLGGMSPVLWQYWIGGCQCGDFNVATQYVDSYTPATGGSTYSDPC